MSGGVDSSVAAALIARNRRELVGFSFKLIDRLAGSEDRWGRCCSPEDFRDARAIADRLGFAHYVIDLQQAFERGVLAPFVADYAAGRTPSPCVRCNSQIKFGAFVDRARAVGAQRVVTGHYANLVRDRGTGRTLLQRAADPTKDQSYFLFDLSQAQLAVAEFPLGGMTKDDVRGLAREIGLSTADKPESMDLCFVAAGESYRSFLDQRGVASADDGGEIVDAAGTVVGRHTGVAAFTVGQRRGLGLGGGSDPLFVVRLDPGGRRVVVGSERELWSESCRIERVRWIPFDRPSGPLRAMVRLRSSHSGAWATLTDSGDGSAEIIFDEPQRAITPGQAAVAYDGDWVLGGGWITADDRVATTARGVSPT